MKDDGKAMVSAGGKLSKQQRIFQLGSPQVTAPLSRASGEGVQCDATHSPSSRAYALPITALGLACGHSLLHCDQATIRGSRRGLGGQQSPRPPVTC